MAILRWFVPRPVRKAMHPVASVKYAATPRVVKKAMHVRHPVGTLTSAATLSAMAALNPRGTARRNASEPTPRPTARYVAQPTIRRPYRKDECYPIEGVSARVVDVMQTYGWNVPVPRYAQVITALDPSGVDAIVVVDGTMPHLSLNPKIVAAIGAGRGDHSGRVVLVTTTDWIPPDARDIAERAAIEIIDLSTLKALQGRH